MQLDEEEELPLLFGGYDEVLTKCVVESDPFRIDFTEVGDGKQLVSFDPANIGDLRVLAHMFSTKQVISFFRWRNVIVGLCALALVANWMFIYHIEYSEEKQANISMTTVEALVTSFNLFIQFMLSVYLGMRLSRWQDMKLGAIGGLMQNGNEIMSLATVHVPYSDNFHGVLRRYLLLQHAIMYSEFRGSYEWDFFLRKGLITKEEIITLKKVEATGPAMMIWVWILTLFSRKHTEKAIPNRVMRLVRTVVQQGMSAANRAGVTVKTKIPFQYVHLMGLLVSFYVIGYMFKLSINVARTLKPLARVETWHEMHPNLLIFSGIPILLALLFFSTIYLGFLELAMLMDNPYGTDYLHFPRAAMHEALRKEQLAILACRNLPQAITELRKEKKRKKKNVSLQVSEAYEKKQQERSKNTRILKSGRKKYMRRLTSATIGEHLKGKD